MGRTSVTDGNGALCRRRPRVDVPTTTGGFSFSDSVFYIDFLTELDSTPVDGPSEPDFVEPILGISRK